MKKEKGTWKRVLAKILVFSLVFQLAMPVMAAPAVEEAMSEGNDEITFLVDDYHMITGFKGTLGEELVIPAKVGEVDIWGIEDGVFDNQSGLKSVTINVTDEAIEDSVVYVIDGFAGCSNLEEIQLPASAYEIADEAFRGCASLEPFDISIADNSTACIGSYAFTGCEKFASHDWVIEAEDIYLSKDAFTGLKVNSLTLKGKLYGEEASFGEGEDAFKNITNTYYVDADAVCGSDVYWETYDMFEACVLTNPGATVVFQGDCANLTYPCLVGTLGVKEFVIDENANNAGNFKVIDGILYRKIEDGTDYEAFWAPKGKEFEDGVYVVPDGIAGIATNFYTGFDEDIAIPSKAQHFNNTNIKEVVLPNTMRTVEGVVYENAAPLTLHLPENPKSSCTVKYVTSSVDGATLSVVLPASAVNDSSKWFFNENSFVNVETVILPEDMTVFPSNLFNQNYKHIKEVKIAEGNTAFKEVDGAIYSADGTVLYWWPMASVTSGSVIEIPEGVKKIEQFAFNPVPLTSTSPYTIVFPKSLEQVMNNIISSRSQVEIHVVTNKCSDDVIVGANSGTIDYLYVNDEETNPFVAKWKTEQNHVRNVITGGVAKVVFNIMLETEDGSTTKAAKGACDITVSKVENGVATPLEDVCTFYPNGDVEILLQKDGEYRFDFEPLNDAVYLPSSVENVNLTVASPDATTENITNIDVTINRVPAVKVLGDTNVYAYLFDDNGDYIATLSRRVYGLISKGLQSGDYTVLLCKSKQNILQKNSLSEYTELGLEEGVDYKLQSVTIKPYEESIEDVVIESDGLIEGLKEITYLAGNQNRYTKTMSDADMGYSNLEVVYSLNQSVWDDSTVNVLVTLPSGVTYIEESVVWTLEDGSSISDFEVEKVHNGLRFVLPAFDEKTLEGRIRFSVTVGETVDGVSNVYAGNSKSGFIGSIWLGIRQTIHAPVEFSKDGVVSLYGIAQKNKKVELYIGNLKVGETVADNDGNWNTKITIEDPVVGEHYLITAKCINGEEVTVASDETVCVEKAIQVTNIAYEYLHPYPRKVVQSEVDMRKMKGKKYITTVEAGKLIPFNMNVDIVNDENIQELFLGYDAGQGRVLEQLTQADSGKWALNTAVTVDGLPNELTLVAKVKNGDTIKEVDICEFIIKWIIDPSGYIYEVVPENRVEGATVTTYYKDEDGNAVKWNAEEFQQINPVISDGNGNYGWFVPAGQWKVVAEKEGYIAAESEWLPVPPPQLDVNLELVSTMEPKVEGVDLSKNKMLVRFNNYVLVDSITTNSVVLKDSTDAAVEIAFVEAVDAKTRNEASIAKEFVVTFATPIAEGTYAATVAAGVKSYADVAMSEAQTVSDLTVAGIVKDITTPEFFVTKAGTDCTFEVSVVSDEEGNGRLLTATSTDESKVKVVGTTAVDVEGKATITLSGSTMTVTEITLGVENSSFTKTVSVMVIDNQEVFDKMFAANDLVKPQVPDENNGGNEGGETPSTPAPVNLSTATIASIANQVYTGSAITPDVKVTADGKTLVKNTDYTVAYKNNTDAGTAEVTITGKGNYTGNKTVTFTIDKAETTAKFEKAVYQKAYGAKKFTAKVVDATGTVTYKSSDSKVVKVDKNGKITIKGTGRAVVTATIAEAKNYKAGTVETVIEVSPKKASIKKLSAKKTQLTVTWKKDKRATGYEVKYSTSKKFKKAKTVLVKKTKTTKTTLKKLKKGKTYYVKVRAYKEVKVGNKKVKIYSPYSKTLKKKLK